MPKSKVWLNFSAMRRSGHQNQWRRSDTAQDFVEVRTVAQCLRSSLKGTAETGLLVVPTAHMHLFGGSYRLRKSLKSRL